jgi:hypothetical protein
MLSYLAVQQSTNTRSYTFLFTVGSAVIPRCNARTNGLARHSCKPEQQGSIQKTRLKLTVGMDIRDPTLWIHTIMQISLIQGRAHQFGRGSLALVTSKCKNKRNPKSDIHRTTASAIPTRKVHAPKYMAIVILHGPHASYTVLPTASSEQISCRGLSFCIAVVLVGISDEEGDVLYVRVVPHDGRDSTFRSCIRASAAPA